MRFWAIWTGSCEKTLPFRVAKDETDGNLVASPLELLPSMANPEDLGRYRLKRLLGRGALGEVWAADDLEQVGAKVAVKIMHAAEEELALARIQFAREGRLASMLRHPNIV